jgi:prevent-host-death family protein
MPDIRPISDLRNNFASISEKLHREDEPIYLTKNGVGDMVVMSIEFYEKQLARLDLYGKLKEADDEIAQGAQGVEATDFVRSLMKK